MDCEGTTVLRAVNNKIKSKLSARVRFGEYIVEQSWHCGNQIPGEKFKKIHPIQVWTLDPFPTTCIKYDTVTIPQSLNQQIDT